AQAAHAQRIAALGELAGGIAHDFNNILQTVAGTAASIERRSGDAQEVRRLASVIGAAAERGGAISRRLLAFGRRGALNPEAVDVSESLNSIRDLLTPTFTPAIAIAITAAPGLPAAFADRSQLETALLNLATNARDAMPRGGILTLSATPELVA